MDYRLMSPGFRAGITRAARSPGSILTDGRSLRSSESICRSLFGGASSVECSPAHIRPFRKVCQYCQVIDRALGITSQSEKKNVGGTMKIYLRLFAGLCLLTLWAVSPAQAQSNRLNNLSEQLETQSNDLAE